MTIAYADNNATAKMDEEILKAMQPFFSESFGNPSSMHRLGQSAKKALEQAREKIAGFLDAKHDSEIIFTSGGTESNHLAILGLLKALPDQKRIVTTSVEHSSVLSLFQALEEEGYEVVYLPVDDEGQISMEDLRQALMSQPVLVSIMCANNETGVIFPIDEIAKLVKKYGAYLHVDGVQAAGKIPVSMKEVPVDLFSLSAHKLHGPKGIGALYVKKGVPLSPLFYGGGQERNRRSGTENVAGAVGMAKACELAANAFGGRIQAMKKMRDRLEEGILLRVPEARLNGSIRNRIPNTTNISFPGLEAESILLALNEENIYASSGSACSTGAAQPSHVLLAMGRTPEVAKSSVRFSLSRFTQEEEIDLILKKVPSIIYRLTEIQAIQSREVQEA